MANASSLCQTARTVSTHSRRTTDNALFSHGQSKEHDARQAGRQSLFRQSRPGLTCISISISGLRSAVYGLRSTVYGLRSTGLPPTMSHDVQYPCPSQYFYFPAYPLDDVHPTPILIFPPTLVPPPVRSPSALAKLWVHVHSASSQFGT